MTELLRKAFDEASRMRDQDQDLLAKWLLDELRSDERWQTAFAGSINQLDRLAAEAINEHRAGRTQPLDPETL